MSRYRQIQPPNAASPEPVVRTWIRDWRAPKLLYRTFPERLWANHFARGRIRISTLSSCRDDTHPTRGDPGEGKSRYTIPYLSTESSSADLERARALGLPSFFSESRNCSVVNYKINNQIPDAWILCFTEEPDSEAVRNLGRFEVQISSPASFCATLTHAIAQIVEIEEASIGPALYEERERTFPENRQPIAFVKPPGRYQDQKEVRMVWLPRRNRYSGRLPPLQLAVPWIAELCERRYGASAHLGAALQD